MLLECCSTPIPPLIAHMANSKKREKENEQKHMEPFEIPQVYRNGKMLIIII